MPGTIDEKRLEEIRRDLVDLLRKRVKADHKRRVDEALERVIAVHGDMLRRLAKL